MQAPLWLNRLDDISAVCAIITKVIPKPSQPGPISSDIAHRLTSSTMRSRTFGRDARRRSRWFVRMSVSSICSNRSEEHTSELQSLMRISYAVFCLKKKNHKQQDHKPVLERTHD